MNQANCRRDAPTIDAARRLLAEHIHFRGRVDCFRIDAAAGVLTIGGTVPSFYLKQVVQTLLRDVEGVARIINQVRVANPSGLSSCAVSGSATISRSEPRFRQGTHATERPVQASSPSPPASMPYFSSSR